METSSTSEYTNSLAQVGLDANQSVIYETLLKNGSLPARTIAFKSGISRQLTYKILDELVDMGLTEKNEARKITQFEPVHPLVLKTMLEKRLDAAQNAKTALDGVLQKLTSDFNLISGKPSIRFLEGKEGVKEVLFDSLTSPEEIYTYADMETVDGYAGDINEQYVRARIKKGAPKKLLVPDTPASRAEIMKDDSSFTTMRLLTEQDAPPFHAAMQIYDNKISYVTFTKNTMTGTIINDPAIYAVHRFLFEHQWRHALTREDVAQA